jgi:glycosyltransferase involved in cell wall biosynthesis
MHVLYFHQHFSTVQGAAGTRSYEIARRLVLRGHQVTMVCGHYALGDSGLSSAFVGGKREGLVDGIKVVQFDLPYSNKDNFWKRTATFLKFVFRGVEIAMFAKYDLLFASSTPLTAGIPGILARWLRRKPFVFEVRDLWPELPKAMGVITNPIVLGAMSVLEVLSYRSATGAVALSPGILEGIRKRSRPSLPIIMVPNGSDLGIFLRSGNAARPANTPRSELVAVFTGAHGRANGLDSVIAAARELQSRGRTDIKLVFLGDGSEKPRLQAEAKRYGLDNCVFLPPIPKLELANLLRGADVGLMILANVPAFYYGTSPNKFFDYISAGLPVLNNYPGWVADMIGEHRCGVVVKPDDPIDFADALEHLQTHRELLPEMGRRGRELAEHEFSREELSDRLIAFLERVTGEARV